eukprot:TRINITY_DN15304_c0_g1_i1.p1 TRINITY_DN15304_c0_g1~~TRINITY_DN15304_c0_g1_i1.p1  ORF type:complete len:160 (+),score=22.05 TRINITY_DN15304_c0_g1_i1:71-481(+)
MPVICRKVSVMTQTEDMHICGSTQTDNTQMAGNTTLMTSLTPSSTCTAQQYQHGSLPQYSAALTGKQKPMQAKSEKKQNQTIVHCTHPHICTRYSATQHNTQHTNSQHTNTQPTQHNRYQNTNYSTKFDTQYNTLV